MSWSLFFSAYAVPRSAEDPLHFPEPLIATGGGSRSGWFQWQCEALLDTLPGHDALRFIYDESLCSGRREEEYFSAFWTVLGGDALAEATRQLESLLEDCKGHIGLLANSIEAGGLTEEYFRDALTSALAMQELPELVSDGDDGDSPLFMFTAFAALLIVFRFAQERDLTVVFYTCSG
jgi:hypothetical protein